MADISKTKNAPTHNPPLIGYIFGAGGAALFATKGIIIKLALIENVDAVTTLTWRMIIATPVFILIGWWGYQHQKSKNADFKIRPSHVVKSALVGILGYYLASYLDFKGLEYITAQLDRLILMTHPIFVVLIGAIAFGRRVTRQMIIALLVSYAGLAVIFVHDLNIEGSNVVIGTMLVLGAALSYAFYQLLAKPVIDEIGSRLFTSIAMTGAGFAVVVHFMITHELSDIIVSPNAMWMMFAIGTVATVFPAYLIAASIGHVGPAATAVIGNVAPLVTIVLAVTILGEAFSTSHAIGAFMVIIGVLYFTRAERRATQTANAERIAPKL